MGQTSYDIAALQTEFDEIYRATQELHDKMKEMDGYYESGCFYSVRKGEAQPKRKIRINLLKAFSNKNIYYISQFPKFKVPAPESDQVSRQVASQNEKIITAVHQANHMEITQLWLAYDGTVKSEFWLGAFWDFSKRMPVLKRYKPEYVFVQFADENDPRSIVAVYVAFPMTAAKIKKDFGIDAVKYRLTPTGIDFSESGSTPDSKDRYMVVHRWDGKVATVFCGDKFIVKPYGHGYPRIPFFRCVLFDKGDRYGGFFLDDLLSPQAEIHEQFRKKANVLQKMGNPTTWGKMLTKEQTDKIEKFLKDGGGFVNLKEKGELGFLQLNETTLFDTTIEQIFTKMKQIAGYPDITWGDVVGANSSGEAVNMYYQPTTQMSRKQWVSISAFYRDLNSFILQLFETFGRPGEQFDLKGLYRDGVIQVTNGPVGDDGQAKPTLSRQFAFGVTFTPEMVGGLYNNLVLPPQATPRDDMQYKRLMMEAGRDGFMPLVKAYEEFGAEDPEDWLELLSSQKEDPRLNPDLLNAAANNGQGGPDDMVQ